MSRARTAAGWSALCLAALLVVAGSSLVGEARVEWREILGAGEGRIYWQVRVPRALLAGLAGAGLAVGGVILQCLFRNPLAEPYTLGVASGAALAAAVSYLFRDALGLRGDWTIGGLAFPQTTVLAVGGAVAAMALVMLVARLRAARDMSRVLLAGVCVAYLCSAGVLAISYLADQTVTGRIVVWLIGSVAALRPQAVAEVAVALAIVVIFAIYSHRALDLLRFGDDLAASRGVAVGRTVWTSFALVGLLTAVIVGNCGPIGFVGLMVPNIARAIFGTQTLPLVISSAAIGAAFLAGCDALARTVFSALVGASFELPVGIITQVLGTGFFFYLLLREDAAGVAVR
jgi:iron complex transport system permease protein